MQNKANVKIGKITISIVATKPYPNEQRTMNNERHSKQTQSKPISNDQSQVQAKSKPISTAKTPCPACQPKHCPGPPTGPGAWEPCKDEFQWISVPGSALRYVSPLASLGRNDAAVEHPPVGEAATWAMQRGSAFTFSKWYYSVLSCGGEGAAGSVADIFFSRVASRIPQVLVNCAGVALLAGCEEPFG